eukprot:IDg6685t1
MSRSQISVHGAVDVVSTQVGRRKIDRVIHYLIVLYCKYGPSNILSLSASTRISPDFSATSLYNSLSFGTMEELDGTPANKLCFKHVTASVNSVEVELRNSILSPASGALPPRTQQSVSTNGRERLIEAPGN